MNSATDHFSWILYLHVGGLIIYVPGGGLSTKHGRQQSFTPLTDQWFMITMRQHWCKTEGTFFKLKQFSNKRYVMPSYINLFNEYICIILVKKKCLLKFIYIFISFYHKICPEMAPDTTWELLKFKNFLGGGHAPRPPYGLSASCFATQ